MSSSLVKKHLNVTVYRTIYHNCMFSVGILLHSLTKLSTLNHLAAERCYINKLALPSEAMPGGVRHFQTIRTLP